MKCQIPLIPHPPLLIGPAPDEAEIRATAKSVQENQQQEVITKIFQQARSNIFRSSSASNSNPAAAIISATPTAEQATRTSSTIERHLYSKYPNKTNYNYKDGAGGGPLSSLDPHSKPSEPDPIYSPKDLSDFIANGTKQDAAYHIFEAVRGCQTKLKNASSREKEFVVVGSGGGGGGGVRSEDGDVRMSAPVGPRREVEGMLEEQMRVQRNTLNVARDPRLQRR